MKPIPKRTTDNRWLLDATGGKVLAVGDRRWRVSGGVVHADSRGRKQYAVTLIHGKTRINLVRNMPSEAEAMMFADRMADRMTRKLPYMEQNFIPLLSCKAEVRKGSGATKGKFELWYNDEMIGFEDTKAMAIERLEHHQIDESIRHHRVLRETEQRDRQIDEENDALRTFAHVDEFMIAYERGSDAMDRRVAETFGRSGDHPANDEGPVDDEGISIDDVVQKVKAGQYAQVSIFNEHVLVPVGMSDQVTCLINIALRAIMDAQRSSNDDSNKDK